MDTKTASQGSSARAFAAILLFVACCLLSTAHILFQAPRAGHIGADDISKRSDLRFAALKARLPAGGVIGYIGEPSESATPDYYLTQYALAPLVVEFSANHSIVVGNFPSSTASEIPPGLTLVQDFGNGVILFAAKDAK